MPNPVLENSDSSTPVSNSAQELLSGSDPLLSDKARLILDREELMTAFEVFNSMSAQLAETYHDMEEQVGSLNNELHVVAEQRLQELKEKEQVTNRLENLLNIMPAGVVVLDSRGRVSQCNPAAEDFLGEPLLGEIWRSVIKRSFAPQVDDGHEISLKDGRRISMVTRSMNGESGQLILLTDLTETRELQHRLDRHRRLSEMGRMMSSLAHQIRTPLSAAMLYAGHLCDSDLTPEQSQRFSDKVLSRLNHLDQQVKDMLLFVKGDVKQTDTITVEELFSALEAAMEVSVSSSQATYTINNACAATTIQCNRETMVGALMNLVTNAIQSRPSGVEIAITASIIGDSQLQLMIVDNGPGFDNKVLKGLQEPFFTTKPQGTGLGLAVVRAVTQAHQGEFEIRSESGVGTVAILTLPVLMSAASAVTVSVEPGSQSL